MKKNINIQIFQGSNILKHSDINVVIDVIRAFSVSHYAFINGIKEIILTNNEDEALNLKSTNKEFLLSGEVNGYKIESFDFGNSPYEMESNNILGKTLVQKTTNGVKVTLESLDADYLFITGYSNAFTLSQHIVKLIKNIKKDTISINIIASHPTGDEDLACALYMKNLILDDFVSLKQIEEESVKRIVNSKAAYKFYDTQNKDFSILDITLCCIKRTSDFVMQVAQSNNQIKIKKVDI